MLPAVYLTCGKIAPEYENLELNVGGSTVAAAIVEATGAQRSRLREMYKDHGDLGDVAQACRHTQVRPKWLHFDIPWWSLDDFLVVLKCLPHMP